jgi:hypothetical protein
MKTIETEITIEADVRMVWKVLMDFEQYPQWNPFIPSIRGEQKAGQILTVSIQQPERNPMTFRPLLLRVEPPKEFRWKGKLGIRGLFDAEHYFILEEAGDQRTRFIHGEHFSGVLVPMLGKTLARTREGFERMNMAIKEQCERK